MALNNKYTLICDEVRQEISGKFILIGLYTGPIGVVSIPSQLSLTFLHLLEADRPGRVSMKFRVEHLETGKRLLEGNGAIQVLGPGPVIAPLKMPPIAFEAVGPYNFVLEIEGERDPIITNFSVAIVRPQVPPGFAMPPR